MKPISDIPPECMYSMKFLLFKSLEGKIGQIFSRKTTKRQLQKEDPYRFSVADTQTNDQPSARCTKQKSHKQTPTQKKFRFRNKSTRRRRKKEKKQAEKTIPLPRSFDPLLHVATISECLSLDDAIR
jgi:hypothetical protein